MNMWKNRLNKAIKDASFIERGIDLAREVKPPLVDRSVKHYTVYKLVGLTETPIAWRLYAADVPYVISAARHKLLRSHESIVEGDPLFSSTVFEAREEIWG